MDSTGPRYGLAALALALVAPGYALAAAQETPTPQAASVEALHAGRTLARAKQWEAAAAEFSKVARIAGAPAHHRSEAEACLDAGLVLPAHDYVLKCSHTFNLLDARGAVGVTERAALFGRMRDLARRSAEAYLEQREALGFPWKGRWGAAEAEAAPVAPDTPQPTSSSPFLLEVGTEELPVDDLNSALGQIKSSLIAVLDENRLAWDDVHVSGTPRRLVAYIENLAAKQVEEVGDDCHGYQDESGGHLVELTGSGVRHIDVALRDILGPGDFDGLQLFEPDVDHRASRDFVVQCDEILEGRVGADDGSGWADAYFVVGLRPARDVGAGG